jgi:endonuclease/exonuclease/phosphatase family metal-dependent hydrolase
VVTVISWNVLHRVHAVNWDEPAIAAHPEERERIRAIAAWLAANPADAQCLQEVSGDQLAAILEVVPRERVHASMHPRVPKLFKGKRATLADPHEYLVTIAEGRLASATTFDDDKGKGFQIVELAGGTVINVHAGWGDKHAGHCAQLAEAAWLRRGLVVMLGDFNADRATTLADLGSGFIASTLDKPTRPRQQPSEKSETIDHVVVRNGVIAEAHVLDGVDLSDHRPVLARVSAR